MSDENVYMRINHDWSVSYPAREQREKEGKRMKTCYLVYRLTANDRELVKIFSTAEKAEEFIEVLEKVTKSAGVDVDYEYGEEEIE